MTADLCIPMSDEEATAVFASIGEDPKLVNFKEFQRWSVTAFSLFTHGCGWRGEGSKS